MSRLGNLDLQSVLNLAIELKTEEGSPLLSGGEILDKILEHDRWKTEATFAHEIRLEEIKNLSNRKPTSNTSKSDLDFSEEDKKFNKISSYGACNEKHLGLIAKTKVWEGANDRASKLFKRWYANIQENNALPLKDLKEVRIKTLLLAFLWASGCSHRISKWPDAPDAGYLDPLKKDLESRFSKFSKHSIVSAYESLKIFWKEFNDYEQCPFDVTLIGYILDEAYTYVSQKKAEKIKLDIKASPLFKGFEEKFPYVPLETLEKYYTKNRKNFVAAGVGALRKAFTMSPPEELRDNYTSSEWPKKWHLHIATFEKEWLETLHSILLDKKEEQKQWKEE